MTRKLGHAGISKTELQCEDDFDHQNIAALFRKGLGLSKKVCKFF